jgi:hypothetical protein
VISCPLGCVTFNVPSNYRDEKGKVVQAKPEMRIVCNVSKPVASTAVKQFFGRYEENICL